MKITIELSQEDYQKLYDAMKKHVMAVVCGITYSRIEQKICGLVLDAARLPGKGDK